MLAWGQIRIITFTKKTAKELKEALGHQAQACNQGNIKL